LRSRSAVPPLVVARKSIVVTPQVCFVVLIPGATRSWPEERAARLIIIFEYHFEVVSLALRYELYSSRLGTPMTMSDPETACPNEALASVSRRRKTVLSVSDPIKIVSDHPFLPGLSSSHVEYLVTSTDEGEGGEDDGEDDGDGDGRPPCAVRRRFSDFLHLADVLAETHRGYFIFPRPEKGNLDAVAAGRSETEFIEFRRVDLERYLTRLCEHPAVGRSEELKVFLEAEGALASSIAWHHVVPLKSTFMDGLLRLPGQLIGSDSSVPSFHDVSKNARHTNDVMRMLKEAMLTEEAQGKVPEEELAWRRIREGVERYSESLVAASTSSERLVRESERLSIVMGDMALSMIRMAKYEDDHGSPTGRYSPFAETTRAIAEGSRQCGMELAKTSKMERQATSDRVAALDPINNQLAMVQSALDALRERESAFVTMRSLEEDLKKTRESLDVLQQVHDVSTLHDPAMEKKLVGLRNDVAGLEAGLRVANTTYETLFHRNKADYARWLEERRRDMTRMRVDLSGAMARHGDAVAAEWGEVARAETGK